MAHRAKERIGVAHWALFVGRCVYLLGQWRKAEPAPAISQGKCQHTIIYHMRGVLDKENLWYTGPHRFEREGNVHDTYRCKKLQPKRPKNLKPARFLKIGHRCTPSEGAPHVPSVQQGCRNGPQQQWHARPIGWHTGPKGWHTGP